MVQPITVKAGTFIVIDRADAVADFLFCRERCIQRNVTAFGMTAENDVTVKARSHFFQIHLCEWIRTCAVTQIKVQIFLPAGNRVVCTAEQHHSGAIRQQRRATAVLQRRKTVICTPRRNQFQRGKPRLRRHLHHVDAVIFGKHQSQPFVRISVQREQMPAGIRERHRFRVEIGADRLFKRHIYELAQRQIICVPKRQFFK